MALLRLILAAAIISSAAARPTYASLFPNGNSVPCPPDAPGCALGACAAVGHASCAGGGALNDFGRAFAAAGYVWTAELCEADSDGDGVSNGAELGDPGCVWKSGAVAQFPAVSHPGVAESVAEVRPRGAGALAPAPAPAVTNGL